MSSFTTRPELLKRTITVPASVTLLIPTISTVPVAVIASVPSANFTRPTVASRSNKPVAVGFRSPLANFTGPWPRNTSRLLPAKTSRSGRLVKLMLPSMVTKSPTLNESSSALNENTSPSDAPNLMAMVRLRTLIVSSTAPPVLLTRRLMRPLAETPPAPTSMSPERTPAMPVGVTSSAPSPRTIPWLPTVRLTLLTATRVSFTPASFAFWSKAKSPVSSGPPALPMRNKAPSNSTRTYGPPGTSTETAAPATVSVSVTGWVPVLIASVAAPPESVTPGTVRTGLTEIEAATPPAEITSRPDPLVIDTNVLAPCPKESERFVTPARTSLLPLPLVVCSRTKFPVNVWPPTIRLTPVPPTRTKLLVGVTLSTSTATVKAPAKDSSDRFEVTVPAKLPRIPAASIVSVPEPLLTLTKSVVPSPSPT